MDQALSLWFLLGWIGGDSCNLIGSFLADQLPLQVGLIRGWGGAGQAAWDNHGRGRTPPGPNQSPPLSSESHSALMRSAGHLSSLRPGRALCWPDLCFYGLDR